MTRSDFDLIINSIIGGKTIELFTDEIEIVWEVVQDVPEFWKLSKEEQANLVTRMLSQLKQTNMDKTKKIKRS